MGNQRTKFATQIDESILVDIRKLAKDEGRQLQSVIEEALQSLLEERKKGRIRPSVLSAMEECNERYGSLLQELAK
ncbi:MAG: hypothetical protein ACSHXY_12165 [Alphaproteobacteria bacterium]